MKNFLHKILFFILSMTSLQSFAGTPSLSSLPGATATMFLDFDGQTVKSYAWNGNNTLLCAPSGMNDAQITEIFNRVSEDYRPFNINITTDSAKFLAAPLTQRIRLIVTTTSAWYQGVGGVSYIGSFAWGDDVPGFIFPDRLGNYPKYIAECCSHEGGHTVGLSHQSTYDNACHLVETYSPGTGDGEIGWAPVMGNSYYKNMTGWNDGPTPYGCAQTQDNLTIITTTNGFTYRTDDYTGTLDASTFFAGVNSFNADGIITTNDDEDAFRFTVSQNAAFHLEVKPFGLNGGEDAANLDVKVDLYNASRTLIGSYNPANILKVTIDTTLTAGDYYMIVTGAGNINTSDYGSLGSYNMRGTTGVLPIKDITLKGNLNNGQHNLSWRSITDEPVTRQSLELSKDGISFRNIASFSGSISSFSYIPSEEGVLYYRIKAATANDQTMYSNVVVLKASASKEKQLIVSTFVHDVINVHATSAYQYKLISINGKTITTGTGNTGMNTIPAALIPAGVYVIQFIGNDFKQTERIIKQ